MVDRNWARGMVNQILYGIDSVDSLDAAPQPCADAMFAGTAFLHGPAEYLEAVDTVVAGGRMLAPADMLSERFDDDQLLGFLRALGGELRSRLAAGPPPAALD